MERSVGHTALSNNPSPYHPVENSPSAFSSGYAALAQKTPDNSYELDLLVNGVHCAGCIQKIESRLAREQDVEQARLNFSTRRLHLVWNGADSRADDFTAIVSGLGYSVYPYDPKLESQNLAAEEKFLLLCLGVAGFAMGNIMMISIGLWTSNIETMGLATRDFMHWISGLIALPAILFSGRPFFRSALDALRGGHTNMDVPISLALVLANGMSLFETFNHGEHVYFDSAVMLMFFLLIGRYLDLRARRSARGAATDLLSTFAGFATVLEYNKTRRLPIRELKEHMILRVTAGEKFPVDGVVLEGESSVDTSLVTGETMPRALTPGMEVFAGTLNLDAPVCVEVAKAADDSLLADIVRLMEKAGQGQARYVRIADRAARLYTPVVHTLALAGFLGWWLVMGAAWQDALMIAVTILIITCPCALGLAVPVVQVLATEKLMKRGVLVKSGDALERLAGIDTALFDKTGTLTLGRPVLEIQPEEKILQMAASLAAHSAHPLSKSLRGAYHGDLLALDQVQEFPGRGLEGFYQGRNIRLGSRAWCGDAQSPAQNQLEIWLNVEDENPYAFIFSDQMRSDAHFVIDQLKKCGLNSILLSGDRAAVVQSTASALGLSEFHAEQTPPQKFEILENLKKQGHKILMVGDGLNDAPVLAGADISMAPGTAIDMAQNAADIVFMGDDLRPVYETYNTAVFSQILVKQNFLLAVLYNIIAVPLAFMGLVTPLAAAIAMSGSSLAVIANSFRLKRFS